MHEFVHGAPQAAQEAVRAFHAGVRPFQRLLGWAGEHHEQAGGVRAVGIDDLLRVHAVVFGFGHFFHAADDHGLPVRLQHGGYGAAFVVRLHAHFGGVEPGFFAVRAFAVIRRRQHHALREQLFERLAHGYDAFVVHQLGEETGVQQVQNRVFDAADILVGLPPIRGGFGRDHVRVVARRHIAELVPA